MLVHHGESQAYTPVHRTFIAVSSDTIQLYTHICIIIATAYIASLLRPYTAIQLYVKL